MSSDSVLFDRIRQNYLTRIICFDKVGNIATKPKHS
jgi:hypothetical protein